MTNRQHAQLRQLAADLRGVDRFDDLVRLSVIYAHRADPELREAKLAEMAEFVRTAARDLGRGQRRQAQRG